MILRGMVEEECAMIEEGGGCRPRQQLFCVIFTKYLNKVPFLNYFLYIFHDYLKFSKKWI